MPHPTLFHLHFNTPDIDGATDRLGHVGVPLQRRFGSVRGEGVSLEPSDKEPNEFRLKLQVHQRGAVNITLAPGQHPHFDHFGLITEDAENILNRAKSHDWSVRSNERRTFVMTPWRFRIEVHSLDADVATELGDPNEAHIGDVALYLADTDTAREAFDEVFGDISELRIEPGEGPWVESFSIVDEREASTVSVQTLLSNQKTSS